MGDKTTARVTDPLKSKVDKHENHLQKLARSLSHANTHMEALSDLAERLRFHVEVKKAALDKKPNRKFEFETTSGKNGGKMHGEEGKIHDSSDNNKNDKNSGDMTGNNDDLEKTEKRETKGGGGDVKKLDKVEDEEDKHFKFPANLIDREFLTSVETLIEGIALVRSEVNFGRLVREVKGPLMEDVQEWRNVVTVLQKYDDQVRRAVEFFHRQNTTMD